MNSKYLHDLIAIDAEFDRPVKQLRLDSRAVQAGDVFFACQGLNHHGKQFIHQAIEAQAAAILIEAPQQKPYLYQSVICIPYPDLARQAGLLAAQFYQHPSQAMQVIGVTGTNGKTSISHYIAQGFASDCGLLGTLGYGIYGQLQAGLHTTPDAIQLQQLFAQFKQQHIQQAVMEVSSHALAQQRTAGVAFDLAVYSNLSRDHLDYHQTMAAYADSKRRLFIDYPIHGAVINADDAFGRELIRQLPQHIQCLSYSIENPAASLYAQYHTNAQAYQLNIQTPWGGCEFTTALPALFNISNLLAALGALLLAGVPLQQASQRLQQLKPAAGRMEMLTTANQVKVIIDYAHTPDALEKALHNCRQQCTAQLWCVFGCGGDRDQGKRPLMGAIAARYADNIILTNDNPRHENPEHILQHILNGIPTPHNTDCIPDRAQAIRHAIKHAQAGDWLLIAGKGHESYQEIAGQRFDFNDKKVVLSL